VRSATVQKVVDPRTQIDAANRPAGAGRRASGGFAARSAGPALFAAALVVAFVGRLVFIPASPSADRLVVWSSAIPHVEAFEQVIGAYEAEAGIGVELQRMPFTAIDRRLRAAFWAGRGVPDLIELPQEKLGVLLSSGVGAEGFLDLSALARESGPGAAPIADDLVPSRRDLYRVDGRLIGIAHDIHPVMLAYRWRDFEDVGLDPDSIETWGDFIDAGRLLMEAEHEGGRPRFMLSADERTPIVFQTLLLQRGGNWFDEAGTLILDDPLVLDTLVRYTRMVYGEGRIADTVAAFPSAGFFRAIEIGAYTCFICPDWMTRTIEENLPTMAGELRLMPLPAWEQGGPRTSTWGATMLGISSSCENPVRAWELVRFLYADRATAESVFRETNIVSPLRSNWELPAYDEPRAFWGGQAIGREFLDLAEDVPTLRNGPAPQVVLEVMADVLTACGSFRKSRGDEGLEAFAQAELRRAHAEVDAILRGLTEPVPDPETGGAP
jgi:arabinosaccharide transport system substrate-binding protein